MTARLARLPEWAWLAAVTVLAAVLRLWNLGSPRALVFDETYYVKDAWTLLQLGYESRWPEGADEGFVAGDVDAFLDEASFVVHPPLGKWLIALGLGAFGAEDPVGWRVSMAVVGTLAVAVLWLVARILFRSPLLATIAAGLLAVDGHAIVMSRIALLDNALMLFALLGFLFVLLDRRQSRERLERWMLRCEKHGRPLDWGPALWARPWLVAAGLAFGLATAVKWSGLYFLAVFAIYTLVVDALARRRAGVPFWFSGTALKQAPVSFLLTVPIAAVIYLASWAGWFASDDGYHRRWALEAGNAWQGPLAWVPLDLQSWWHYQVSAYNFHVGLDAEHGWASPAYEWLPLLRPTALYRLYSEQGENGCSFARCEQFISTLPNPLLWYLAVGALGFLVWRLLRHPRSWRAGLILTGVIAGYAPWLLYPSRTMFQFYAIAFEPYMILALTFALGAVLGRPWDSEFRRGTGIRVVIVVLALVVLLSAYFYSIWTGMLVPEPFTRSHYWLPGWR
ncbi:phospholipid carrier-dependent glycosyltransferase [Salinibacterium sp. SYSU T00001]|uniref:dolichyl-phosphate-mannose--protein mannosyltransferase n=1 Tax=Homoserinimonas sedimenticola TaxID=2986805 RepID=UPI0022362A4A|nr:phospholipid carrier-dependent glycosyltransferase [Salinibacterium sedimenticola]MCW4386392.1 phospholipid carrier-dependent glycosyltransferase [Salinibacterium sedimenticola]